MTPKRLAHPLLAASLLLTLFMPMQFSEADDGFAGDDEPPPIRRCTPDDDNPYTGYWWKSDPRYCVPGIVTMQTWYIPAPPYAFGAAVWYAPHIMEATARFRGLSLDGFLDGVSLMAPSDIGRTVWLRRPGHDWEGPFLVVDTASRSDIWPIITKRKEIVEVGFQTAARWGIVDAAQNRDGTYVPPYNVNIWRLDGVEVLKMDEIPPWISNHEPIDFVAWWTERVEFVNPRDIRVPHAIPRDHYKFPGWRWMATDPAIYMNAYDDWFEFLFPGDPRFVFDLPNNYPPPVVEDTCFLPYYWCTLLLIERPGFYRDERMEGFE